MRRSQTRHKLSRPHLSLRLSLGKTNSVVAEVIDRVPPPQEGIAENGERTCRLWKVHAEEGRDAGALDLQDVVVRADGEVVAGQGESQVREGVALVAVDGVLAVVGLLCADLLVPAGR